MISLLTHLDTECQWSVNNLWCCKLGNQGITRIFELITALLTAFVVQNTDHKRKNIHSKIIDITSCNAFKKWLLAVEWAILFLYYCQTARAKALYETIDGPTGQPTDNPANSDGVGDFQHTVPGWTIQVYWWPQPPICRQSGSDLDLGLKRRSGTVHNTRSIPKSGKITAS